MPDRLNCDICNKNCALEKKRQGCSSVDTYCVDCMWLLTDKLIKSCAVDP